MSQIVIKGLKMKLELRALPLPKLIRLQKQQHFQNEGIRLVDVSSIKLQQLVMVEIPFH
jgi:hypothetical protein